MNNENHNKLTKDHTDLTERYQKWSKMCDWTEREMKQQHPEINTDEEIPENWSDPLELLGSFFTLISDELELENNPDLLLAERKRWQEFIDRKGAQYVWACRRGIVANRLYAYELFGY